jgi:alkanesulfonate monooxygenase SsuD/methylene tetrahydromethanopterin reductase-like flavin-dependent oxidoreductase (luciferase family)
MRLGVALPIVDIGGEPAALREFVQAAEAIGYHGIAAPDHVLGANAASRPAGRSRAAARPISTTTPSCCSAISPAAPISAISRPRC